MAKNACRALFAVLATSVIMTLLLSSFAYAQMPQSCLVFAQRSSRSDCFWYSSPDRGPYVDMLNLWVGATPTDAVIWRSVTLQAHGSGSDDTDIESVSVWLDLDRNGKLDPIIDENIGSGAYESDDAELTITLSSNVTVPAGKWISVLFAYNVRQPDSPLGSDYAFNISGAEAAGLMSQLPSDTAGMWQDSNRLTLVPEPISIAEAKKLPIGSMVFLENKTVTADFQQTMAMAYMEEPNRSAGIGVIVPQDKGSEPIWVDSTVSVFGTTLLYGGELVVEAMSGALSPGRAVSPVAMPSRLTGGGAFGNQPALVDGVGLTTEPKNAVGLSTVGMLVRISGWVTGYGSIFINNIPYDVAWIDDGCGLFDGFSSCTGIAIVKPADWSSENPPSGYCSVAGIMRAVMNQYGLPVRLLVPRTQWDLTPYSMPQTPR